MKFKKSRIIYRNLSNNNKKKKIKKKVKKKKKPILKVEKTPRLSGAIDLDLFQSIGKLKICEKKDSKTD
jgi:hypothetical protein